MVKAKAKADRAAARQAAAAATAAQNAPSGSTSTPHAVPVAAPSAALPVDDSRAPEPEAMHVDPQEGEDALPRLEKESTTVDRTELLRSKPEVVGRFLRLMVPILVDVYAASVITPVRVRTLTGLLKAVSFLDGDELKRVFMVCVAPYSRSQCTNERCRSSCPLPVLRRPSCHRRTTLHSSSAHCNSLSCSYRRCRRSTSLLSVGRACSTRLTYWPSV